MRFMLFMFHLNVMATYVLILISVFVCVCVLLHFVAAQWTKKLREMKAISVVKTWFMG